MKSLHKFLRAVGFSKLSDRRELQKLVTDCIINATTRAYTSNMDESMSAEFCKDFAPGMGIAVCGEFDKDDHFTYDYYYPYIRGQQISSQEDISVERHAAENSYAGVCDECKVGVSLIFYLQNKIPYMKAQVQNRLPIRGTTVNLSALSVSGTIILPIDKSEKDKARVQKVSQNRRTLIDAARRGNEDAIESLTLEDMDMYTIISKRIQNEDVFSLVDTYFMPYGVECDQYSVLGEIMDCRTLTTELTGEQMYLLTLNCNELTFDVCINIIDLFGEPKVGRRFKGSVWLQGYINFPE